jgi:arylformamidase
MTSAPLYREFTSAEQIDWEYKPSLRIADAEACMRRYGEHSAEARTRISGVLDVPYGPTRDEKIDIFPAARPNAPVFVFIHGGYWRAFSAREHSFVALGPVALGITTVLVDYSLCPKVTIDEITRQCRAAVAWTLGHIGEYGGDPKRVAIGGHSAGGHLSAMCLETRWDEDYGLARDPLAAALLVSGVYDIEPLRHSFLQPTIQLDDGIVRRNSPLFGVRPCATPALVTWGAEESVEFERQSTSFHAAWQAAGNRSELLPQLGAHHFSAIEGFGDPAHPLCRWLAASLGVPS